jgi:methylmalonyl-CoA mutase N-terminal domain/subunit
MTEQFTQAGIPLKPLYKPEDIADLDYDTQLADPGQYPFTRGNRLKTGKGAWIHRELSGEGDPSISNQQIKNLIAMGQTGMDVIGDSPTQGLMDADHPIAEKTAGTQGTSLCRQQDYNDLFNGLPIDSMSTSMSLPPSFGVAGLFTAAEDMGVDPAVLRGSVVNGPFYGEECSYAIHMPFKLRVRLGTDAIEFATKKMPKFHAFLEDTYFIADAGLNIVEEMALGFVEVRHLTRELLSRGLDIDDFAPRIAFLVDCRMDFFEAIAQIRATRRLYARMMKEEFNAKDPRSLAVNIASHTSGLSMTAQQPINNVVRGTVEAMALALSGVQAMEISTFDEAYRTPSKEAHEVGLRTQQILELETNVSAVNDPFGGSYFIESLTNEVETRIWDMVMELEAHGDNEKVADGGVFRSIITNAAGRYAQEMADGTLKKVGVNAFTVPEEEDKLLKEVTSTKIEPCTQQVEKIKEFRASRNMDQVKQSLKDLHGMASQEKPNLIYGICDGYRAGATMGEMAGVMRQAYGRPYDPYQMVTSPIGL